MRKRVLGRLLLAVVVVAAIAGGYWYWAGREAKGVAPAYRTEAVDRGTVDETVVATGAISPVTTVSVGSQVSGIVARLHADFNSPVRRGQLLAELDPSSLQAVLDQRRADLARAEVEARRAEVQFRRMERLLADGLSPEVDYDTAKADFESAQAQVEQSRAAERQAATNLSYSRIYSPIDGVVVNRAYDVGQTVAASFQAPVLFTIAQDLTKMQVQADVDQADVGRVAVGQKARFTVDAYPDEEFAAEISQIRLNATVNQNVTTYPVILTVANPELRLHPQMTANVTIVVSRWEDVLRVPNGALRFRPTEAASSAERGSPSGRGRPAEAGASFARGAAGASAALDAATSKPADGRRQTVHVLGPDGEPKAVPIRVGATDGRHSVVLGGELPEGTAVITGLATAKNEVRGRFPASGGGRF